MQAALPAGCYKNSKKNINFINFNRLKQKFNISYRCRKQQLRYFSD